MSYTAYDGPDGDISLVAIVESGNPRKTMTPQYTFVVDKDGDYMTCGSGGCENCSVVEFHGFCEHCWASLSAHKRAILRGENPPDPPAPPEVHVVHERVTVRDIPPEPSSLWRVLGFAFKAAQAAAVAWLLWRNR